MLAKYKIVKFVNLPDQVGVNDNGKVLMLNCEMNDCAVPGTLLASYKGSLYDNYDIDVAIHIDGLDDFTVVARRNASDYYDEDEDYEEGYYDEDDEIYYAATLNENNLLTALGGAFAAVEKELAKKKECPKVEVKPCKDRSLKELKKLLDALYEDEE